MDKRELIEKSGRRIFIIYGNVKRLRLSRGMSVKQFSAIMGIPPARLIKAEACIDTECLNIFNIARLCNYFGIEMNDITSENFTV